MTPMSKFQCGECGLHWMRLGDVWYVYSEHQNKYVVVKGETDG